MVFHGRLFGPARRLVRTLGLARQVEVRPSDVFIVSFPRSGNTWTRFMLANLLTFDEREEVDFHSVHRYIPDIEVPAHHGYLRTLPDPRLIKSHACRDDRIKRAIYLVRDGRDVMTSYYHYQKEKQAYDGSLLDFLGSPVQPCRWDEHVKSWLDYSQDQDVLLVRYEDVLSDPHTSLARMAEFAGLPTGDAAIDRAVQKSSAGQMRQLEETRGRPMDEGLTFVRKARSGDWKKNFGPAERNLFESEQGSVLSLLGYEVG